MQPERRKSRRTANACIACRQSKIKCSGDEPCSNCKRRLIPCRFTDGGNKVVVSEKFVFPSPLSVSTSVILLGPGGLALY
ncbi:unnamed protein product [Clonostachys byssicola]|uniref:Zn(2)-C6 fungal-type domain-containing protein n=1 Tax=Clonostachys byssicola TaxID=160290 RepID=A0A9N9YCE7_9HYPO|nr:unnamed protein product [Clonostachys byssicola]